MRTNYELYIEEEKPCFNRITKKFLPDHIGFHKGKTWNEFMSKEGQKRVREQLAYNSRYINRKVGSGKKPVLMMGKETDKVLGLFESIKSAGQKTGLDQRKICECCKGTCKSIKGYRFQYV